MRMVQAAKTQGAGDKADKMALERERGSERTDVLKGFGESAICQLQAVVLK